MSPKQTRLVAALLSEPTLEKAAQRVGITDRTAYRWLKEPEFRQALAAAEAEAISEAARSMAAGSREAVEYLRSVLQDKEIPSSEKIRAALGLLSSLPPLRVLGSIEARIEQLKGVTHAHD